MKIRVIPFIAISLLLTPMETLSQTLPPPPEKPAVDKNGVDVLSGKFLYSQQLMSIGPKGIGGLDYTVTFSNDSWRHNFNSSYVNTSGDYIQTTENIAIGNTAENFTWSVPDNRMGSLSGGDGFYVRRDGTIASFAHRLAETYDYVTNSGTYWNLVDYVQYPNGILWTFHYRDDYAGHQAAPGSPYQSTRLQSVTSNTGYQIKFNYAINTITTDATSRNQWLTVTSVVAIDNAAEYCDPSADTCSLSQQWPTVQYSQSGSTLSITNSTGNTTVFDGTYPNFLVKTADSATNNISYTRSIFNTACPNGGGVAKVTNATIYGRSTNYSYSSSTGAVTSSGPLSQQYTYVPGGASYFLCAIDLQSVTDPLNRVTTFQHDGYGRLTRTTLPEGNYVANVLDDRGNVTQVSVVPKAGSGSPTLVESHTFPDCTFNTRTICNQPATYTDPRGNVTNYTYDANHGGLISEMKSAPSAGMARPLKLVSWTQKNAYIKNASGALIPEASPIWVMASETQCQTVAGSNSPVCDASAPQKVAAYQYGADGTADNLLVRGVAVSSDGTTLRTCYGYDRLGRRVSETNPNANLSSCP
ncbi:MAG: RHS repeat domain-containing protein [Sphingomonas sp.]